MTPNAAARRLVVLYGIGGLSDVGRHAILAALEHSTVEKITIVTEYPELLQDSNWECNCTGGHTDPTAPDSPHASKLDMVHIDTWKNSQPELAKHFHGADGVISCLGHRQPGILNPKLRKQGLVAHVGNKQVIQAMKKAKVERVVVCSSIGIQEDSPPMEFHWGGKIMAFLFRTLCRKAFADLTEMELEYKAEENRGLDYLFVRPVGLGEEVVPENKWFLQKEKGKDALGGNMAKMDCARYLVQEALTPTRHRSGVVIGSEPPTETS